MAEAILIQVWQLCSNGQMQQIHANATFLAFLKPLKFVKIFWILRRIRCKWYSYVQPSPQIWISLQSAKAKTFLDFLEPIFQTPWVLTYLISYNLRKTIMWGNGIHSEVYFKGDRQPSKSFASSTDISISLAINRHATVGMKDKV